jgi:hypothetical protein
MKFYKPCIYRRMCRRCSQDILSTALVHRHRAGIAGARETLLIHVELKHQPLRQRSRSKPW